jgi:hypothetical protein
MSLYDNFEQTSKLPVAPPLGRSYKVEWRGEPVFAPASFAVVNQDLQFKGMY